MLQTFDDILNRFTMYRVLLYSLIGLLIIGFVFALTGNIGISAGGLIANILVLAAASYAANHLLGILFKIDTNTESWLITALILALILPTSTHLSKLLYVALTAAIAMASKFLLVWRRSPLCNPAAVATVIMSILGLLPATWWIGSPAMAAFTAIAAVIVLRKQRKFSLFFAFAIASSLIFLFVNHLAGYQTVPAALKMLALSWPLLFLGSIMLTEPSTLPETRYYQVLYGLLVGTVFTSQLHAGQISSTPQLALIAGNIFAVFVASRFAAKLTLKEHNTLAKNIHELVFEKPKQLVFAPGQYMQWTLSHPKADSRGNRRSFSIASSPTESELRLTYKTYDPSSSFKKALQTMHSGEQMNAAQPTGDFVLPADKVKPLVFIAGGIGITPFRSMVKYLMDSQQKRNITLLYQAKKDEVAYRELFDQAKSVGVTTHYLSDQADQKLLQDVLKNNKPLVYISGPNGLVQHYRQELRKLGVTQRQIRTDYFSGY